jgi:hypothetical protein
MFTIKLLHIYHFLKDPFSISLLNLLRMVIPVFSVESRILCYFDSFDDGEAKAVMIPLFF